MLFNGLRLSERKTKFLKDKFDEYTRENKDNYENMMSKIDEVSKRKVSTLLSKVTK